LHNPAADGVLGTIQREGYREGIDGLRYLATRRKAIDQAAKAGATRQAEGARIFLAYLDVNKVDLDSARNEMIGWILELKKAAGTEEERKP
jgi:hypothetical protein